MSRSIAAIVDDLVTAVAAGCPAAIERATEGVVSLDIAAHVGDERFGIEVRPGRVRVAPVAPSATVRLEASARAVRDVLLGDDPPTEAVLAGRIGLFGPPAALVALDGVVRYFVAGVARTQGADRLLEEFLELAGRERQG